MRVTYSLGLLVLLGAFISPVAAQDRTIIRDGKAARMLLGKHKISLQWISWDFFGSANVSDEGGTYTLKGEQKGRGFADFVRVDGVVTEIDAKQFTFEGSVITQVSHINGGKPCERKGTLNFRITGTRKYWRMQQIENPCDQAADYVDIYFRH